MHPAAVEQIHRIDGHLHVGGILALGDIELLLRLDPVPVHQIDPALEAGLAPISIGPADIHLAEFRQHGQHRVYARRAGVIRID